VKKNKFRRKITAIVVCLSIAISSLTILLLYRKAIAAHKEELRQKLVAIVSTGALAIDAQMHSQIPLNREGVETAQYKELRMVLRQIRSANPEIRYVYTMVKAENPNILKFVMDAEPDPKLISYPGDDYDISKFPNMRSAFNAPVAENSLHADKWGTWLSAYGPVRERRGADDKESKAVAIFGIDMSAKKFIAAQAGLRHGALLALIISILLSLAIGTFMANAVTNPIGVLVAATRKVAKGDFSRNVNIHTKDEIEELGSAFNSMMGELKKLYQNLQNSFLSTIYALSEAIEAKDPYTRGHSERVTEYSLEIAQELGLPNEEIIIIKNVALLHDIGKIGISESILDKPGKLSEEEWAMIKNHPIIGEIILRSVEALQPGISIVKYHHEHYDGSGYPDGLKEKEIPFMASIVTVADAFDAMTSARPYRAAMTVEAATEQLKEFSGKQFDPKAVDALLSLLKKKPTNFQRLEASPMNETGAEPL